MPLAPPDVLTLPTVSDVLALPELRSGQPRVVAGTASLDRPVRWAHVAEIVDIAHLLAGGELLLTTGIALPESAEELRTYIDTLADAHVAGIVIELVQRWHELPHELITAAEHRDLPVITLTQETRYVAVTEAVITQVRDAQLAELRAAEHIHEAFTALTVSGAEPAEILHHVTDIVNLPVVLETPSHHVIAYEAADTDPAELLTDWSARSKTVTVTGRTGYDPTQGWLVTMVGARGDDWGRLIIVSAEPPAHRHIVVAERAASALALNQLVANEHDSLERQTHTTLLAELLATHSPSGDLATRASALGVPLLGSTLVGLAARPHIANPDEPTGTRQQSLRNLADSLAAAARDASSPALVGMTDATTVHALLTLSNPHAVDTTIDQIARNTHRISRRAPHSLPLIIAAGTATSSIAEARRTLVEASHVADAAPQTDNHAAYYRLNDVHLPGLLHQIRDDQRVSAFAERELGPLHGNPRLREALRHYCEHGGNKSAAAAAAHMSRSAYYAQLGRIEQLLDLSLDSPTSMLSLYAALLILDTQENDNL